MWLITLGHPAIRTRFYAAIDALDRVCLVDDAARALRFRLRQDAEHYAALAYGEDDWSVDPA